MTMPTLSAGSRGAAGNKIPRGYSAGRLQQFTPEQNTLFQNLFSNVSPGSQLSQQAQGLDQGFAPQEEYAKRQFQEFSGDLGSRFSGLGMGARRGSGFQNQASQGAQDFAMKLAMQRQGLQRQAFQDLMGLSEGLLNQRPNEQFLIRKPPKPPSFGRQLFGALMPVAGAAIGGLIPGGGLAGAGLGAKLGGMVSQGFQPTQY